METVANNGGPTEEPWQQVFRRKRHRHTSVGSYSISLRCFIFKSNPSISLLVLLIYRHYASFKFVLTRERIFMQLKPRTAKLLDLFFACLHSLCAVSVHAFVQSRKSMCLSEVHRIDSSLPDSSLLDSIRASVPIRSIYRLGTSQSLRIEFVF